MPACTYALQAVRLSLRQSVFGLLLLFVLVEWASSDSSSLADAIYSHPGCHARVFEDNVLQYLSYYEQGIRPEDITAAEDAVITLRIPVRARIRIIKNVVYVNTLGSDSWVKDFIAYSFQALACKHELPDVEFVLQIGDGGASFYEAGKRSPPVFSWARQEPIFNDILIPYYPGCCSSTRHHMPHFMKPENTVPWSERQSAAVWRGTTTGSLLKDTSDWKALFRTQVVLFCKQEPRLCNAGFTGVADVEGESPEDREQRRKKIWEDIVNSGAHESFVSMQQHKKFKYLILMDGNGAPSSRSIQSLLFGSTVVKSISSHVEFFYSKLVPWHHYAPFTNAPDLNSTLHWLLRNDDAAQVIARNGREFALKHLSRDVLECYMLDVLYGYASLQTFKPEVPTTSDYTVMKDLMNDAVRKEFAWFVEGSCPKSDVDLASAA